MPRERGSLGGKKPDNFRSGDVETHARVRGARIVSKDVEYLARRSTRLS